MLFFTNLPKLKKIGIFDSGLGGLTVLEELVRQLPSYSFIYYADTLNCPYGPKGKDEIIRISSQITEFLISLGCSTIVVACNTATAAAIDFLRENYEILFVGMEPAVKPAALATKTKSIGVLATEGTFNGRLYRETTSKYAANINVSYQVGEGLVEMVENGTLHSFEAENLLRSYIEPMLKDNIDHLVLGCTHYPFYMNVLKEIVGDSVEIIDPAPAVAQQAKRIVEDFCKDILVYNTTTATHFYSTGTIGILKKLAALLGDSKRMNTYSQI